MLTTGRYLKSFFFLSLILFISLLSTQANANQAQSNTRQLMQIAEYINVDYKHAVSNGSILSEAEYSEMQEFSALAVEKSRNLENGEKALEASLSLQQAVQRKADPSEISPITVQLRHALMALAPAVSLPDELLATQQVQSLYQANCASCHGATGEGNGPLAASLDPAPINFTDVERAENRSLVGLYDAISNGIDGTGMAAFSQLSEQERWSLAFYVGGLAFQQADKTDTFPAEMTVQDFVSSSPAVLSQQFPTVSQTKIEQLRADPAPLFKATDPIAMAKQQLNAAHKSYLAGEYKQAQQLAVSAYLDGYELAENALDAYDPKLRKQIEATMMQFRQLSSQRDQQAALSQSLEQAIEQLSTAQDMLSADTLSDSTLFTASFVILLREGLEALLVVLALVTVLVKTDRRDAVKYVHSGWIVAMAAGFATWWAAQSLISISGASREIMEGFAALIAAIVLFYVGFWMHSKTNAANWQAYIRNNIDRHLSSGALWGIAGLSFIAVYREVFETVLFYQSLMTQSLPAQFMSIVTGFLAGVVVLAVIAFIMVRYSLRLPIGKFFAFTTYLMLALCFVLIGKAIAALQEAALVNMSPLPVDISVVWLGIHATWEGILSQLLVLVLSALLVFGFGPFGQQRQKA